MAKTVSTLEFGDKLYEPRIDYIREIPITKIEKSEKGIKVGTEDYYSRFNESDYNAAISTMVYYENRRRSFYLRIEDARIKQKELQLAELKARQNAVKIAIEKLNYFTLRYFTDETVLEDVKE